MPQTIGIIAYAEAGVLVILAIRLYFSNKKLDTTELELNKVMGDNATLSSANSYFQKEVARLQKEVARLEGWGNHKDEERVQTQFPKEELQRDGRDRSYPSQRHPMSPVLAAALGVAAGVGATTVMESFLGDTPKEETALEPVVDEFVPANDTSGMDGGGNSDSFDEPDSSPTESDGGSDES